MTYQPTPFCPIAGPLDWPEDFRHEKVNYQCLCCLCKRMFVGHKRRVMCKPCAEAARTAHILSVAAAQKDAVAHGVQGERK